MIMDCLSEPEHMLLGTGRRIPLRLADSVSVHNIAQISFLRLDKLPLPSRAPRNQWGSASCTSRRSTLYSGLPVGLVILYYNGLAVFLGRE